MGSTVPAVLDYLVAGLAAVADDQTLVLDGQLVRPDGGVENDYIAFGYNPDPESPAVESADDTFFGPGFEENYEIFCQVGTWTGDAVTKISRDRAFTLLDLVTGFVLADTKLGGLVMSARPLSKGVIQTQSSAGAAVSIPFVIQIKALQSA
jgi:hypothetical protein